MQSILWDSGTKTVAENIIRIMQNVVKMQWVSTLVNDTKKNEMGAVYGMYEGEESEYRVLVGQPEGQRTTWNI